MQYLLLAAGLLLVADVPVVAQTPFPEFTGSRLYVSGVSDNYQPLIEDIQRLEQSSPQTYYVVVVQSSGSGSHATRDYLDNLYQAWQSQAARKGLQIDPQRSVIILLAERNRQISVRTGALLQSQYGLRDQAVDQQLVQPHFIPHAKAGNYLAGLQELLKQISQSVAAKDATVERTRQQAAERSAQLQRNAQATVENANNVLADVRKELAHKKSTGMELGSLENQIDHAAERLDNLKINSTTAAEAVLRESSAALKELQEVQSSLLQLATRQKQGETLLHEVESTAHKVQEGLVEHRRSGLATDAVSRRLESTWKKIETARDALSHQPDKALVLIQNAAQQLVALQSELDQLPQLSRLATERQEQLSSRRTSLDGQLERASQIGADTRASQERLKQLDQEFETARDLAGKDYPQALAHMDQLQTSLAMQEQSLARAYQQRYFLTRTAPVSVVAMTALILAAVLGTLRWRHSRHKRRIGEQLNAFRAEVTQWMERLDALKQRHQFLPFTDQDFTSPMMGQTLALYNDVQVRYDSLRNLWLALMDRRTKAEGAFAVETPLGVSRLNEVAQLLAEREDTRLLQPQFQECVEKLDQLNQAHEIAQKTQQQVEAARLTAGGNLQSLAAARLPADNLQAELADNGIAFQKAIEALPSDPLGAHAMFLAALEQSEQVKGTSQRRLEIANQWRATDEHTAAVEQRAREIRGDGVQLQEQSANPDPVLDEARRRLSESWTALERAEDDRAEQLVEQARLRAEEADNRINQHLLDKQFVADRMPRLQAELQRLRSQLEQAATQREELLAGFHPDSWLAVADYVPRAGQLIEHLAETFESAGRAASPEIQHYGQAAQQLRLAESPQQEASMLLDAVSNQLNELKGQRREAGVRRQELADRMRSVTAYFQQHENVVSAAAQQNRTRVREALEQAEAAGAQTPPHWPRTLALLEQAAISLAAALKEAEQDVHQQQQVMSELAQLRSRAANIGQLLRSSTADRPRANQRFQGATQSIEQIAQSSSQPNAPWGELLAELSDASADLSQVHQWAEEDIRLAEQAAAALRTATAEVQRTSTFVSFGVSAHMGMAESQLNEAAQRLRAQDYEQAIALADSAERTARQAHLEAVREAEERRRKQEAARQRRELERMAASLATAAMRGSSRGGLSGRSFSSGGFSGGGGLSGGSGTSSSSWSSGTSQSGW